MNDLETGARRRAGLRRRVGVLTGLLLVAGPGPACGARAPAGPDDGRAEAAAFLEALHAGQVEPAWQATSVEFKSLMGLDSLRDYVRRHPALDAPAEFVEVRPSESDGLRLSECVFRATPPPRPGRRSKTPPSPARIAVLMARNGGTWTVERLAIE